MMGNPNSTLITRLSWGHMEVSVNGHTYRFKDCKVWPGGANEWDWNHTGTRHRPGIQPADIEEILAHDVEVMILSRGMERMLQTCPATEHLLQMQGLAYHIAETQRAVDLFNTLMQQGKKVGGIFHSTC
jgi:hypothetical protein